MAHLGQEPVTTHGHDPALTRGPQTGEAMAVCVAGILNRFPDARFTIFIAAASVMLMVCAWRESISVR
jgi:hypothetical protein